MVAPQYRFISTTTLARALGVTSNGIRNALSQHGHFRGVTPAKCIGSGGRLLWPADSIERMVGRVPNDPLFEEPADKKGGMA